MRSMFSVFHEKNTLSFQILVAKLLLSRLFGVFGWSFLRSCLIPTHWVDRTLNVAHGDVGVPLVRGGWG